MNEGLRHIRVGFITHPEHRREALLHVALVDATGTGVMATVPLAQPMSTRDAELLASSLNDGLKVALSIWDDPEAAVAKHRVSLEDVARILALKQQSSSPA